MKIRVSVRRRLSNDSGMETTTDGASESLHSPRRRSRSSQRTVAVATAAAASRYDKLHEDEITSQHKDVEIEDEVEEIDITFLEKDRQMENNHSSFASLGMSQLISECTSYESTGKHTQEILDPTPAANVSVASLSESMSFLMSENSRNEDSGKFEASSSSTILSPILKRSRFLSPHNSESSSFKSPTLTPKLVSLGRFLGSREKKQPSSSLSVATEDPKVTTSGTQILMLADVGKSLSDNNMNYEEEDNSTHLIKSTPKSTSRLKLKRERLSSPHHKEKVSSRSSSGDHRNRQRQHSANNIIDDETSALGARGASFMVSAQELRRALEAKKKAAAKEARVVSETEASFEPFSSPFRRDVRRRASIGQEFQTPEDAIDAYSAIMEDFFEDVDTKKGVTTIATKGKQLPAVPVL